MITLICGQGHVNTVSEEARFCGMCGLPLPAPHQAPAIQNQHAHAACTTCGGAGQNLGPKLHACPECKWLRALAPGYEMHVAAFQWADDGAAMAALRSSGPLNSAARAISDRVGRRWIETTFNGIRLSPVQLPKVFAQAVHAARLLGMPRMPDVYVSGERAWDALTFGTDKNSFIVLGSALLTSFNEEEMLFIISREMGHCLAGHALWKTVIQFMVGELAPRKGMMSRGILSFLDPAKMVEGALEMPLLGWARQAEITADRAALLATGNEKLARKTLISWALKSSFLTRQINLEEWIRQEEESNDDMTKLSEMATSSSPYLARRLRLLTEYARSTGYRDWRNYMQQMIPTPTLRMYAVKPKPEKMIRVVCPECKEGMNIPDSVLSGKTSMKVRCANAKCRKVVTLKKNTQRKKQADMQSVTD